MRLSIPQPCPHPLRGNQTGAPIFHMETLRLTEFAEVAKFAHQGFFFRDRDSISGAQGIGKGDPEGKGLVITSLILFTCAQGGLDQLSPQAPNLQVYHRGLWA